MPPPRSDRLLIESYSSALSTIIEHVRLVTYARRGLRRLGALADGAVVDLPEAVGHPAFPITMESLVRAGLGGVEVAREALERSGAPDRHRVPGARVLTPILPSSLRGFLGFEPRSGGEGRTHPAYSTRNHRTILGPGEDLVWPSFTRELDYEASVACVIGARGRDLDPGAAGRLIFGYTLMNDWCARDVERSERSRRIGPAKARDFATSLGPCIATVDELDPSGLSVEARVDGETWSKGNLGNVTWSFQDMVAHASQGEDLWPGDVLGSGTFGGGCGMDLGRSLRPGSVVELQGQGLGTLRNRVGPKPDRPSPARRVTRSSDRAG